MRRGRDDQTEGFGEVHGGAHVPPDAVTLGELCGAVLVLADAVVDPEARVPVDFVGEGRGRL